jgi:uncharacterized protein YciI
MPLYSRLLLITGPLDEVHDAAARHVEHLRDLRAAGRLRAAGEYAHGDGFLDIFEAADRLEAEGVCRASPLVQDGLATWMLREWTELEL